jgi:hypothetical protein
MIIPTTNGVFIKFITVIIPLIAFMILLIYSSISGLHYVPNINMFYDMLFDNFETSGKDMLNFVEMVVRTTPTSSSEYTASNPVSSTSTEQFGNMTTVHEPSPITYYINKSKDYITNSISSSLATLKHEFSRMITKSYVSGNTIRTTRLR